jgi:large subunit ribosomal protein L22
MEAKASAKYLHGSAQKARLVVDMIRGKNINQALAILQFTNKRAAGHIEKCVRSAIANASEAAEKANIAIDPDELWIKAAFVDRGPTKNRRRMRPAPQGRAYREKRHFCHVTVLLSSDEKLETKKTQGNGKAQAGRAATTPAESRNRRRGGAAAAPRAKRTADAAAPPQTEAATTAAPETIAETTTAPVENQSAETSAPTATTESAETTE